MKIKGISPIEQHVEKLVLIVFALFAMAMFVMQFNIFGDPNAVQIEQNRKVSPGQAVDAVRDLARRKEGEIDATPSADEVPARPGPLDRWTEATRTPAVPPSMAVAALAPGTTTSRPIIEPPTDDGEPRPLAERVIEIAAPAPTDAFARAFGATVHPLVPAQIPEVSSLVPADQPLDIRAVSIQATFPIAALRAALAEVPPESTGLRPLPRSWWVDQIEILDVEVERDEIAVDGSVIETTTVPPVPGAPTLRDRISKPDLAPRELPEVLSAERASREQIRRPSFLRTISGEPWIWPALAAERDAADPDRVVVQRLVDERRRTLQEIERLLRPRNPGGRQDDAPGRGDAPPDGPPPIPPPGGGRPSPSPSPSPGTGGSGAANIAKRVEDLRARVAEIEKRLREDYNRNVDGDTRDRAVADVFTEPVTSLTAADATDSITVWSHDVRPEPGKTYRYRVRVWITNPLFGHADQLGADQKSAATRIALCSPWSPATDPVTVYPSPALFVSSASTGEGLGGLALRRAPTASLDLFAFHYGYWRLGDITVSPGDQVRAEIAIPVLPRFEVVQANDGAPTIGATIEGPSTLSMVRDVFVLGVIPPATGSGDLVLIARPDGTVEVRRAGADAGSDAAARMRDSASRGMKAVPADPRVGPGRE